MSWSRTDAALLLLVTVAALIPRVLFLDRIPPLVWDDEINYLDDAIHLLEYETISPAGCVFSGAVLVSFGAVRDDQIS